MDLSRRDLLELSGGALAGTALGAVAGLGPGPMLARAQRLRIKYAPTTPSVCPWDLEP